MNTEELWAVARKIIDDNPTCGLPHIERISESYLVIFNENQDLDSQIKEAVRVAVIFHDIGGAYISTDHARLSCAMLSSLFKNELAFVPESIRSSILHAVDNHSLGLRAKEARTDPDIVLGLLAVIDHTDAIGAVGVTRTIRTWDKKKPWLPKTENLERTRFLLKNPQQVSVNDMGLKGNSLVEHLVYNYGATHHIILPVSRFLPCEFIGEISGRLAVMKSFIESFDKRLA